MTLNCSVYHIRLEFITPILGTVPKDREVFETFISGKAKALQAAAPDRAGVTMLAVAPSSPLGGATIVQTPAETLDAEAEDVSEIEERGWTGFFERDGRPYLLDYQCKGFLKETGNILKGDDQLKIAALKSKLTQFAFIHDPRQPARRRWYFESGPPMEDAETESQELIQWRPSEPGQIRRGVIERPLRAETAKGPRTSLARSDVLGDVALAFTLVVFKAPWATKALLEDLYAYGQFSGTGQWRNAGWGRFRLASLEEG